MSKDTAGKWLDALDDHYAVAKHTGHGDRTQAIVDAYPPLAAVARAVLDRPWWRGGYEDESGDEISRCDGCQADLDEHRGHSACHDIECRYLDSDRALDALEAAAAEGGGA